MSVCPLHRYILHNMGFMKTDVLLSIYHHHDLVSFFLTESYRIVLVIGFVFVWATRRVHTWILICLAFRCINTSFLWDSCVSVLSFFFVFFSYPFDNILHSFTFFHHWRFCSLNEMTYNVFILMRCQHSDINNKDIFKVKYRASTIDKCLYNMQTSKMLTVNNVVNKLNKINQRPVYNTRFFRLWHITNPIFSFKQAHYQGLDIIIHTLFQSWFILW